ncbi:unnamed protein product [Umbelopsis ramanniana]
MPRQQTIITGLISILRPEFQYLVPVIRESSRCCIIRTAAGQFADKQNTTLPTETEKLQSYFQFSQGLFMDTFSSRVLTPDKEALKQTYDDVFESYFSGSNRIHKPSILSSQIRTYNARMMIANLKNHLFTLFFKFQFHTLKSEIDPYIPEEEAEGQDRRKMVNSMAMHISRQINLLVFVENRDNVFILNGRSSMDNLDPEEPYDNNAANEDEEIDNDSDSDDSDDSDNESVEIRTSKGERLVNTYIPTDDLQDLILAHRRAMGILLQENHEADHRHRRLTRTLLKERNLLSLILSYYKFLRNIRSNCDARRFQIFPEHKMTTKYFHLDEQILGELRRYTMVAENKWPIALQRQLYREEGSEETSSMSIWHQIFHLDRLSNKAATNHIGMSTDGFECSVSFKPQPNESRDRSQSRSSASRNQSRRSTEQEELIDLSSRSKGMFKLLKLDPQSVQAELESADLIGVDPGLKSLITAVRSENLYDKMQITKGYWVNARLSQAFSKKESRLQQRLVKEAIDQLSLLKRDSYDQWVAYLAVYYRHFNTLHAWSKLGFYRRWRRTREIATERAYATMKNTLLCKSSVLPPQKPIAAAGPLSNRVPLLHQANPKIVAWGTGCFGNRKGSPPLPVKGLAKYVARFARVIKVDEFRTSITCLCDTRTVDYKTCLSIVSYSDCVVIRHRSCTTCRANYNAGTLINRRLPWTYTLDTIATRRHDHQAVWHKDVLAAMNMRRIVKSYALTGEKPTWNKR